MSNFDQMGDRCAEMHPSFQEPFSGRLYDRPYGAMPANPFRDVDVRSRQSNVDVQFEKLFKYPPEDQNIPEPFRQFVIDDYTIGEQRRKMINYDHYGMWRQGIGQDIPDYLHDQIDRFESGRAEPDDVLDIAIDPSATNLESLEIGKLTHPYWQRIQHLPGFRSAVSKSIESHGGTLLPSILPYRSIGIRPHTTIVDGKQRINGFIVKYKHDLATIPLLDGRVFRVVERQLAAYRADEASGFSQRVLGRMHDLVDLREQKFDWTNTFDEYFDARLTSTGCKEYIERKVQKDSNEAFVVPISTTIYGYADISDTARGMVRTAFKAPNKDEGIAYFGSGHSTEPIPMLNS